MMDRVIEYVHTRQILDSRGRPTVEVEVGSRGGRIGRASAPSGASTGSHEACEIRDGDPDEYAGLGVGHVLRTIKENIAPHIKGLDCMDQQDVDQLMVDLDGTPQKTRFGANAILPISLAVSRLAADHAELPLYRYLGGVGACDLPVPFVNVINGGAHASHALDIQELMIVPMGAKDFCHAMRMSCEIFYSLGELLRSKNYSVNVGDEGGYAPALSSIEEAFSLLSLAVKKAGYCEGEDIFFACDIAATELYSDSCYHLKREDKQFSRDEMIEYLAGLVKTYPLMSIEDGLEENDISGFAELTKACGDRVQIVGDDLTVTSEVRLKEAIELSAINTILIKPNQIGTLSETLRCIALAKDHGIGVMISHRSGETEDPYIADLAVAVNAGQIKTGSVSRTDRVSKYNRLLRIAEELGGAAQYGTFLKNKRFT